MIREPGDRPAELVACSSGMKNWRSPAGPRSIHPRRRIILLPVLPILCASAHADEPSDEMVIEAERPDAPDPGQTSASVTVIAVDETLSAGADVASVVESASGTVVRRLGGLGDYAAVSIRGSS